MMTYRYPLPAILKDYECCIHGVHLQAFPHPKNTDEICIHFQPPTPNEAGLILNIHDESGRYQESCWVEYYYHGGYRHHTSWDDYQPDRNIQPFAEWIQGHCLKTMTNLLNHQVVTFFENEAKTASINTIAQFCLEYDKLPKVYVESRKYTSSILFQTLALLGRSHYAQSMTPEDVQILKRYYNKYGQNSERQYKELLDPYIIKLLPSNIAKPLRRSIIKAQEGVLRRIQYMTQNRFEEQFLSIIEDLKKSPKFIRIAYHKVLLPKCDSPNHFHILVTEFIEYPDEAIPYVEIALQKFPHDSSIIQLHKECTNH